METIRFPLPCLAVFMLFFAGCETHGISSRINENPAVFDALTSEQQRLIKGGFLAPGYTSEMAYLVLGNPTSTETHQHEGAMIEVWIYHKFYPSGECAEILTAYSRARNPNLQRSLNLEIGKATVNVNAPGNNASLGDTSTGSGNDLSLPDLPVYNLYIFLQADEIVEIKLESLDGTVLDETLMDGNITFY